MHVKLEYMIQYLNDFALKTFCQEIGHRYRRIPYLEMKQNKIEHRQLFSSLFYQLKHT